MGRSSHLAKNGPHGLGDPEDMSLRKIEKDVMIPVKIRDRAKAEKCFAEIEEFNKCYLDNGIRFLYKCRTENNVMKSCLTKWYNDEDFIKECTDEYLQERSEYRRTGIGVKERKQMMNSNT